MTNNPNAPIELYDLSTDPGEEHNIAAKHPEIVKKIATYMKEAHQESDRYKFEYEIKKQCSNNPSKIFYYKFGFFSLFLQILDSGNNEQKPIFFVKKTAILDKNLFAFTSNKLVNNSLR